MTSMQTQTLVLTPPAPALPVQVEEVAAATQVRPEDVPRLDGLVASFTEGLLELDPHSEDFRAKEREVAQLASRDIQRAAASSNRMLEMPMRTLRETDPGTQVAAGLVDLRHTLEDLDPSRSSALHGLLSKLPFVNRLRRYLHQYEQAQAQLSKIMASLYRGKDALEKDNAAVEAERRSLWETMDLLRQYLYVAEQLDRALEHSIATIRPTDPERATRLENELLFAVRQKRQDLATHLAVCMQGYLALDVVRQNNTELIRGVERATTTTVAALRTAVIIVSALANQKLVLGQIRALNETTDSLVAGNAALLRSQSEAVHAQASSSGVSLATLQQAFNDVFATMDMIDRYKQEALVSMEQTVTSLQGEIQRAAPHVESAGDAPGSPTGALTIR